MTNAEKYLKEGIRNCELLLFAQELGTRIRENETEALESNILDFLQEEIEELEVQND